MDGEPTTAAGAPELPATLGDYTELRPHLTGGHGRFYLASPPARLGVDGPVMMKVVRGGTDTAFRRFTRELRLFSRVRSHYLVTLYDAGQHEDLFFYSMEWCRGGSLAEPVGELSRGQRHRAVADAARAAHDLHETGVAHRDLRPGNVLLRDDAPACVGDLALAQAGAGSGSVTSMAPIASIGFVDPELIRGDSAGRATDIYSLGAVLHWTLTGRHLHPGVDGADPMLAVRSVLGQPAHIATELLQPDEADLIAALISTEHRPATALQAAELIENLGGS